MASYNYVCSNDHKQVVVRSIRDFEDEVKCERCGEIMSRVFTAPVVTFNGTGWGRDR